MLYGLPRPGTDDGEGTGGTSPEVAHEPGFVTQGRPRARTTPSGGVATSFPPAVPVAGPPAFGVWVKDLLDRPGTLLHDRPPSFREAHARHAECAAHHQSWPGYWGRMLFGYAHLVSVKPALNYLEWATNSPLRLLIHVLAGVAVWGALVLGGYL
jgi:hypothetical protein